MESKACKPVLGQGIVGMKRIRLGVVPETVTPFLRYSERGQSPRLINLTIMSQKLSKFVIILIETST
jgi:hypothetical protein